MQIINAGFSGLYFLDHIRWCAFVRLIAVMVTLLLCQWLPARTVSLYVGQSQIVACPNPPRSDAAINQTAWGVDGSPWVSVKKYGQTGAEITVSGYFTETTYVRCDYYYYWYINNRMYSSHATELIAVTCKKVDISLSKSSLSMNVGESCYLTASLIPSITPSPNIRWQSSSDAVTVSNGYVYAASPGTAVISAWTDAGPDKAVCMVTVNRTLPTRISVVPSEVTLNRGDGKSLSAVVTPSSASGQITWSSNSGNVSVNGNGYITARAKGEALITAASVADVSVCGHCRVIVTNNVRKLAFDTDIYFLSPGEQFQLTVRREPEDADESGLSWQSSAVGIVMVTQSGCIEAIGSGQSVISVCLSDNPSVKADCLVVCAPVTDYSNVGIPHITNLKYRYRDGDYIRFGTSEDANLNWYLDGMKVSGPMRLSAGKHSIRLKVIKESILRESLVREIDVEQ